MRKLTGNQKIIVDIKQFNQERINNCILALPLKRVLQLESELVNISKCCAAMLPAPASVMIVEPGSAIAVAPGCKLASSETSHGRLDTPCLTSLLFKYLLSILGYITLLRIYSSILGTVYLLYNKGEV